MLLFHVISGLRKAGLSAVFINFHLKGNPLVHSLKVSEAPVLIIGQGEIFFPFTCILEFCYLYIFELFRVIFLAITGDEHLQSLQEIMSELPDMKKYAIGSQQADLPPEFIAMDEVLLRTLPVPLSPACRGEQSLLDPVCYIYTSGTTGGLV